MPQQANQPLPAGYVLNGYRIEKPLSSGGFSIVYLANDENGTPFAIKEYLPSSLPLRTEGVEVQIAPDDANLSVFRHGLKCFFEEGRTLAGGDLGRAVEQVPGQFAPFACHEPSPCRPVCQRDGAGLLVPGRMGTGLRPMSL